MTNKEKYAQFCEKTYVPIFSKPWWMDAVCRPEHWNVWLYEEGGAVWAAMPYFKEIRNGYSCITKPPLTQNNGVLFRFPEHLSAAKRQSYEEKILLQAIDAIQGMGLDLYEQQYPYSFTNWLPFFWNHYTALPRYTYVIENTQDTQSVLQNFSKNYRNKVKRAEREGVTFQELSPDMFWEYHLKVFAKQNLPCPFSRELWDMLYQAVKQRGCGNTLAAVDQRGHVTSILFLVWDEQSAYRLLGGYMPEYSSEETYQALTFHAIKLAGKMSLKFDFEGSVIQRINRSVRDYGGEPKQYFRIRKVFNPDIIRAEAEQKIEQLMRAQKSE